MKINLYLKFFEGPKAGCLHQSRENPASSVDQAVIQITRSLKALGLHPEREKLRLKLRSFGHGLPYADGVFSDGNGSHGFILYAPPNMDPSEVNSYIFHTLDSVPFFRAHIDNSPERLFTDPVLPLYPELPPPSTIEWTSRTGVTPVLHGH